MADTIRGNFPNISCNDCGEEEAVFKHWGPLVPEGVTGHFGPNCMAARNKEWKAGLPPRPLGTKPKEAILA